MDVKQAIRTYGPYAIGGLVGWLLALLRHQEVVRVMMCERGYIEGPDWHWANPSDCGQNIMFSTPYPQLSSGEVIKVPFWGFTPTNSHPWREETQ